MYVASKPNVNQTSSLLLPQRVVGSEEVNWFGLSV